MPSSETLEGPPWTILKTLKWTTDYFQRLDIENGRASAEILLAHVLKIRRIDLYLRFDQPLHANELSHYRSLIKKRSKGEPVAYIVGHKEFWSLDLKVNPDVLIPRPETECLVETAINRLKTVDSDALPFILELGTGSGAISIAMAHDFPKARYFASDLSEAAVRLASENAEQHLGRGHIVFFAGRWLDAVCKPSPGFDLIVSNPPYIRDAEIERLAREIRDFEPRQALNGGPDGLHEIRYLINAAPTFLKPGGCLIIEIGYDQKTAVESLAMKDGGYTAALFSKDYGGHDRVAALEKREN